MLQRVEHAVVHLRRHEQTTHRDVAARQRLRHRDEIGLEPPVLEGEELAGPPESGLHLVDREQGAVSAAKLLRTPEVPPGRQVDALALNRLDEEERHVLGSELALESVQIPQWHL